MTNKVYNHLQSLESAEQSWWNKPSMKFDNYKDILPDLRTTVRNGKEEIYRGSFQNHPKFVERYEELGGGNLRSIRVGKFRELTSQTDTDWNSYYKSFNAKGLEIQKASGGVKIDDTDLGDLVGGGPDENTTPYEIDRTIALPVEFEYQQFAEDEGITPKLKLVTGDEPGDKVVDNFAYSDTLSAVDKVDTQQGFQNPSQTVEELSFTPKTGERANLTIPSESEITDESFDNLEFWNSVHTTNTLKNKNDIKIESTLNGPKIDLATAQSKVGTEITVAPIEKVALSADALRQQELREIETHVVTGPPNAAAVDFIKKEGYFQDENTSFESKLANDSNATVDNTYFPPTTPREAITTGSQGSETSEVVVAQDKYEKMMSKFKEEMNPDMFQATDDPDVYDAVLSPEKIKGFQNYLDRLKIEDEKKQNEELERKKQSEISSQQTADRNLIRKADDKVAAEAAIAQSAEEYEQRVEDNITRLLIDDEQSTNAVNITRQSAEDRAAAVKERLRKLQEEEVQRHHDDEQATDAKNIKSVARAASLAEQLAIMDEQYELASDASGEQAEQARIKRMYDNNHMVIGAITALEDDPFKFSTLAYPRNVATDLQNGHFMLFYINVQNKTKYSYTGVEEIDGISQYVRVGDIIEKATYEYSTFDEDVVTSSVAPTDREYKAIYEYVTGASQEFTNQNLDVAYKKRQIGTGQRGNLIQSDGVDLRKHRRPQTGINSFLPTTTRITDSIALYLPPNVSNNTKAGYQDFETGMAGYLAMGGMDIINKIKNHDFQGAADTFINKGGTIGVEMLKKFGLAAVSSFTGSEGVEQTFNKAFGQTLNPYLEVAYTSMGVRTFNYTFKFAPQSSEETSHVQGIIQAFRFHMAPELKGTNHRYLTLPSTFDIHYMFQSSIADKVQAKENSFYNKIATCVLTSCDVNYTPDGVKSFGDGAPTQITMDLSFMETEMLTKQKINEGF